MPIQRVRNWMTPDPITVRPDMTLEAAYALLEKHNIRHLPVVRDGKVWGVLSKDAIRRAQLEAAVEYAHSEMQGLAAHLKTVEEIALEPPIIIQPEQELWQAARLLLNHRLTALPVVSNGRLVGIITASDVFRMVMTEWRADPL